MNEYLYLSTAKLKQFQTKPGRLRLSKATAQVKMPFFNASVDIASKDLEGLARTHRRLSIVMREMMKSGRQLYWHEDQTIQPGDWVQFEMQSQFGTIDNGSSRIFLVTNADPARQGDLLLHGSPDNVVGSSTASAGRSQSITLDSTADSLALFLREVNSGNTPPIGAARRLYNLAASSLIGNAYIEGWARVEQIDRADGNSDSLVVGSPLYIQFADRVER